jgi:hypothetical protein
MDNFHFQNLNFLAILVAWFIHIVLGLIWFRPKLFGNQWSKLTGKELKPDSKWLFPGLLGHLFMVFVIIFIIKIGNIQNGAGGLTIGLLAWIGFIVPLETGELIWERIPFKLFLIRIGNQFFGLAASGFILGAWQ